MDPSHQTSGPRFGIDLGIGLAHHGFERSASPDPACMPTVVRIGEDGEIIVGDPGLAEWRREPIVWHRCGLGDGRPPRIV